VTEVGHALFVERQEALLAAHWSAALAGDYESTAVCLRVLDEQARFRGLYSVVVEQNGRKASRRFVFLETDEHPSSPAPLRVGYADSLPYVK
jgi:hypothetical protein